MIDSYDWMVVNCLVLIFVGVGRVVALFECICYGDVLWLWWFFVLLSCMDFVLYGMVWYGWYGMPSCVIVVNIVWHTDGYDFD